MAPRRERSRVPSAATRAATRAASIDHWSEAFDAPNRRPQHVTSVRHCPQHSPATVAITPVTQFVALVTTGRRSGRDGCGSPSTACQRDFAPYGGPTPGVEHFARIDVRHPHPRGARAVRAHHVAHHVAAGRAVEGHSANGCTGSTTSRAPSCLAAVCSSGVRYSAGDLPSTRARSRQPTWSPRL